MNTFRLIISSPDGNKLDSDVCALNLRGAEGDLAVLAGHAPFVTSVVPCTCTVVLDDGSKITGSVESGLLSVTKERVVLTSASFEFTDRLSKQ